MSHHFPLRRLAWLAALSALLLAGCGSSDTVAIEDEPDNPFGAHRIGGAESLEVLTWNLHLFASDAGETEVELVAQAIAGMGADVVALQEVNQAARFDQLLERLPGWSGFRSRLDDYALAYVWLDSTVTVTRVSEIFTGEGGPLPRPPLVLELSWDDHPVVVINNHFKCCGDGVLDLDDQGDEETRRLAACELLQGWIAEEHPDAAVVLVGDLNDHLDDATANNVFTPFLDRPESYRFADMAVATGPRSGWSWGPGESHLDHILVTDELFAAVEADGAACYSVRIDQVLDGRYTSLMTDHLPVGVVLPGTALP